MKKLIFILLLAFSGQAWSQCDTTGILLELQATTDLHGILIGSSRCIRTAVIGAGITFSGDTIKASDNQTLSISGQSLSILRGNTVTLPVQRLDTFQITGNQLWASLLNDGVPKRTVDLTPYVNTDNQTLSYTSPNLSISGGNSVTITGLMPAGTTNQTLRHNGTDWVANTLLYNNGTKVGVGTTNLRGTFNVSGPSDDDMLFGNREIMFLGSGIANNSIKNNHGGVKGLWIGSTDCCDVLGSSFAPYAKIGGGTETEFFQRVTMPEVQITAGASLGRVLQCGSAGIASWVDQWSKDGAVAGLWTNVNPVTIGGTVGSKLVVRNNDANTNAAVADSYDAIVLRNHNATNNNWSAISGYTQGNLIAADIAFRITNHASAYADIAFHTRSSADNTYTERMYLRSDGNFGVGTTTPYAKTTILGPSIGIYSTGSSGTSIYLGDNNFHNASFFDKAPGLSSLFNSSHGVTSDLGFYYYNGSSRQLGAILSQGNFGINTTTPAERLDVNGKVRVQDLTGTATGAVGYDATGVLRALGLSGISVVGGTLVAADNSNTNELQTLSIAGQNLSISGGNTVALPSADGSETKVNSGTSISVTGSGTTAAPYVVSNTAPDQTVTLTNGGGVGVTGTYPNFTLTATAAAGHTFRDNGTDKPQRPAANYINTTTVTAALADDAGGGETEVRMSVPTDGITATEIAPNAVGPSELQASGTAGTFGSSTAVPVITFDGDGRQAGITTATITGLLSGLTAPRIPFASSANTLTDDANLSWNNTTKRMSIGNTGGSPQASLHIAEGSVATWEPFRTAGTVSGNMIISLLNFQNTGGASSMLVDNGVGGPNAGDPAYRLLINGANTWTMGIDNSVADEYTICNGSLPGTSNRFSMKTSGEIGFSTATPSDLSAAWGLTRPLGLPGHTTATRSTSSIGAIGNNTDVSRIEGKTSAGAVYKTILSDATPSVAIQTAAGSGATATLAVGSNDKVGQITINTGSSGLSTGPIIQLNYSASQLGTPFAFKEARNAAAAGQNTNVFVGSQGSTSFTLNVNTTLAPSTTYIYNYFTQQ